MLDHLSGTGSRRQFLKQASLATAGVFSARNILLAQGGTDVVDTTNGRVRGVTIDGIKWFRGVPYGADTAGKNRFMPPQKVAAWAGVRDCTDWGHVAPQRVNPSPSEYTKYVGWNNYRGGMSEDCLQVNVWTPAVRDNGKRAVMFIIHGGGYASGSGNLEAVEGQHLARLANMVVVSVTHRLNTLGHLDLSAFGGSELESSANVGLLDLVQALQWVRDNAAAFGGDPGSVTITGQSGGGGKCCHLMVMPSAQGLFHKVAIQSGSTLRTGRHERAQEGAQALWTKLGVAKGDLSKLQAIPFKDIEDAQGGGGPVMDGKVVPRDPFDPVAPAISATVPMIIGSCLEDSSAGLTDAVNNESALRTWLEGQLRTAGAEGKTDEVIALYRQHYPQKNYLLLRGIIATDRGLRRSAVTQAERKFAQGKAPAFIYRFDWPAYGLGAHLGATHGTDLSPAFANPTTAMTGNTPGGKLVSKQLGSSFAAFAKTGNPSNGTIPSWSAYAPSQRSVMVFGEKTSQVNDPTADLRKMWDKLLPA
ncbi:MAG: carboxylesterase family protein [Vicinamibacterales bacterium]